MELVLKKERNGAENKLSAEIMNLIFSCCQLMDVPGMHGTKKKSQESTNVGSICINTQYTDNLAA